MHPLLQVLVQPQQQLERWRQPVWLHTVLSHLTVCLPCALAAWPGGQLPVVLELFLCAAIHSQ